MRRGANPTTLRQAGDKSPIVGYDLNADFCAEHEWGIKGIAKAFGIRGTDAAAGIERRVITKIPVDRLCLYESPRKASLVLHRDEYKNDDPAFYLGEHPELKLYDSKLASAWSESDFGILVSGKNQKVELATLYQAILNKDAAIFLGGGSGNPYERPGLVVAIKSRIPQEGLDLMLKSDQDRDSLEKAAVETGIRKLLFHSGKKYHALVPRWADEEKTEVKFWLNPMDQHKYESGWFSVEELEQWAREEGGVVK